MDVLLRYRYQLEVWTIPLRLAPTATLLHQRRLRTRSAFTMNVFARRPAADRGSEITGRGKAG